MDEEMELVGVPRETPLHTEFADCIFMGTDPAKVLKSYHIKDFIGDAAYVEMHILAKENARLKKQVFTNFWIGFIVGIAATIAVAGMLMLA